MKKWRGKEMLWAVSIGRKSEGQLSIFLTLVSEEKSQHWKEYRDGDGGQGCMCVCRWGQGATASTSKKPDFSFFSFGVQSFIIYTYEYIDNTAQCVNLYISIT